MIELCHVTKYYGAHAAVRDLNVQIGKGEVLGLLGLNGAGKTTTLRLLSGLTGPTSGQVHLGGLDMAKDSQQAKAMLGFLPEVPPLYPEMSVRAYLRFVARIKDVRRGIELALDEALQATDLQAVQHERIGTLSHGYHRRIGIAQTIVHKPSIILLDEPTSGLDPVQVVHMRRLIRQLRGKATVVVSSHLLGEIHALCDRILVLDEGRIAAQGTEEELAAKVADAAHVALEVQGDAQQLTRALAALPMVRSHTLQVRADGVLVVQCVMQTEARAQLAQTLCAQGFGLLSLTRQQIALESIFLRLMGRVQAPHPGEP